VTWLAVKLFFGKGLSFLGNLPKEVWYILGAVLLLWLAYTQGKSVGYAKRNAEYAEAARIAAEKARKGDKAARDTVDAVNATVEAENEAARNAAEGSDDPLADALEALR
jgi:hypothetical protein